jgi:O-antigen ligase
MSGFLALGLAHYFQRPGYGWIAGLLFLADLLTFSRGGYLGLLAAVLAYAVFSHPVFSIEGRRRLRLVLGGVLLALLITGGPILSRFFTSFSVTDASSAERVVLWQEALRTITHAPVLGTGLGNYLTSARPFAVPGTPFYAHNLYLDVAVELGLVGLIFFLGIFLAALWFLAREKRRWVFTPAVFAALILYLMHSFFETALFSLHVTLLLILCLALAETVGTEDDQREIRAA